MLVKRTKKEERIDKKERELLKRKRNS